jgi:hypothetical protein
MEAASAMSDETTIAEDVSRLRFLMRTLVQAGFWGTTSADALSVERICDAAEERDALKAERDRLRRLVDAIYEGADKADAWSWLGPIAGEVR